MEPILEIDKLSISFFTRAGEIPSVKTNYLLIKNIAVTGLQISDYRDKTPKLRDDAQTAIFDLYRAKKIDPLSVRNHPVQDQAIRFFSPEMN